MAPADPLQTACDWDPASTLAQRDPLQAFDDLRGACPLARSDALGWSVTRHRDVLHVLHDHETFSNAVSRHLSVPNGMDPPRHSGFRSLVERYFTPDFIEPFAPVCRRLVREGLNGLPRNQGVELMDAFARPFAARAQCAFLGWPDGLHGRLIEWTLENQRATREQDRDRLHELAAELHARIGELLAERRRVGRGDITAHLLDETVDGRSLAAEEIVSILRNWTVGEVGTLSAAIGILVQHLARCPELQMQLRTRPAQIQSTIDEILRIDGPLVANRRVTTKPVQLGGRQLPAGARVSILWIAANRDPAAFGGDATSCRPGRGSASSLLYGAGIHVCPGAPLARLELRVMLEELLTATRWIEADPVRRPTRAMWPGAGPAQLPVRLRA